MSQATILIDDLKQPGTRGTGKFQGLCRDCRNAETCTFPRDPSRPVRSCDEFTPITLTLDRPQPFVMAKQVNPVPEETAPDSGDLKGLCRHCANRFTCTFPKPPGGVWHCDELA